MTHPPLTLPCLRGSFGNWIFYSCMMPMRQVTKRVDYAEEIHDSRVLSELIQRQLEGDRAAKIAQYLRSNEERFFNSLVLATYGGSPEWFDIGGLRSGKNAEVLSDMPQGTIDTLGLLRLNGSEKIFALDGQHRLAGMKSALLQDDELGDDNVPVIMVGHALDETGSRRTRRLFTTLNKTAVAVKKLDIIALDEDDVMAITARRMVETDAAFKDPKIAVISSESMPAGNADSLITIAALYDLLRLIFLHGDGLTNDYELRFNRPDDEVLDNHYHYAIAYFRALGRTFKPIADMMATKRPGDVVAAHRRPDGGHVLFRMIGLKAFTQAAISVAKRDEISLMDAVPKLARFPVQLDEVPFRGTIWDPVRRTIKPANTTLARRLIFYMLRLGMSERQTSTLLADYRTALGHDADDTSVQLPERLASN